MKCIAVCAVILFLFALSALSEADDRKGKSSGSPAMASRRKEFVRKYQEKCLKYDWLVDYIKALHKVEGYVPPVRQNRTVTEPGPRKWYGPRTQRQFTEPVPPVGSDRFAIAILQANDPHLVRKGLGDRFASIISVFLWSLRAQRTFLIQDESSLFTDMFRPVPLSVLNQRAPNSTVYRSTLAHTPSWADWRWAGYLPTQTNITDCTDAEVMPVDTPCKYAHKSAWSDAQVMRFIGNRCWLCAWTRNKQSEVYRDLLEYFNYKKSDDLFEWAGCILRTVLWPTGTMWQKMAGYYGSALAGRNTLQQVGTHFRCGDNAFAKNYNKSDCVVMDGRKWAELRPVTDITRTSPVDLGKCSKTALSKMDKPLLLIASDNMDSAQQMAATANWPDTFIAPTGCHIADNETKTCADVSMQGWFALSLSQTMVIQSPAQKVDYPVSSFSRYALVYSLQLDNVRYGDADKCNYKLNPKKNPADVKKEEVRRGLLTVQGNWRCW